VLFVQISGHPEHNLPLLRTRLPRTMSSCTST